MTKQKCICTHWGFPHCETTFGCPTHDPLGAVLLEVSEERARQDAKWGGPTHDDQHGPEEWEAFLMKRIPAFSRADRAFRRRMIEIAALAIAAVQSYDRNAAKRASQAKP